jgi:hypothetical protein
MRISRVSLVAVAAACAAAGASALTLAVAAPSSSGPSAARAGGAGPPGGPGARPAHRGRAVRRAVHAELVVARRGGGFATVTLDRGRLRAVDGRTLTVAVGTRRATYKTLKITLGADARVRVERRPATVAELRAGQRVAVRQGPRGTVVRAR